MRGLPEPRYLTYVVNVTSKNLASVKLQVNDGVGVMRILAGNGTPSASWPASYRERDDLVSVAGGPLGHVLTHSPIFIPTWTGVYEWFRFGVDGRPIPVNPTTPTAAPVQPSPASAVPQLSVIGTVTALSPSAYRITSANADPCPGGERGRHLHVEPRTGDRRMHPLTDVTIDLATTRFCSVRFWLPLRGSHGYSELHFGTVNGYWMITSDDADMRAILGSLHFELHVRYDDMRFPDALDEGALFTLNRGP
ncbi:MAG TPA: hypothetical protein VHS78_03580 [Candidatus Elarobacter sp.]|nr:hypothetical protein [Candidatus Elarobacter sp.]